MAAVELRRRMPAERSAHGPSPLLSGVLGVAVLLVLWWLATDGLGLVEPSLFASPVAVAGRLGSLAVEPFAGETLLGHLAASLQRWAYGVAVAALVGVPLGVAMASHDDVDAAVTPVFETVRYVPPLAWVPIAILWFGTTTTAQALVVFVAAFPPCVLNAHRAVSSLDPILRHAARTMGASRLRELAWVAVPTGLPTILAGISIAVGNGWMALVGAELVGARSGLGFVILRGQANRAPDTILAAMVVIGLVGAAATLLMQLLSARAVRWRTQHG